MQKDHLDIRKAPFHVLIIGAGIGGLCLAQGLKKSGISVSVYERDHSAHFRGQGYRISLKEEGSQALRDCLPEHLFKLCVATAIQTATRMIFLNHQLQPKFAKPIESRAPDKFFGVNRLTLREILLAELEGVVHFNKPFVRFEQAEHGQVRAFFADGSFASGDLLVGADGTNSVVRSQLLPDARIDDLGSFIYGKTLLTAEILEWVPAVLIDSFNSMSSPDGVRLAVATCRKREAFGDATARFTPTLHLTDVPDYFAWMLDGWETTQAFTQEQLRHPDSMTLHQLARSVLREWPLAVRRIVEEADIPATFLVHLHSAQPVQQWHTTNVTLLGDAIHTMSPGRGEGANTALRDAQLLRQRLVEVETQEVPLAQAKAQYEAAMLHYGFAAVANSRENPFQPSHQRGQQ